jgi:hypothetical protein
MSVTTNRVSLVAWVGAIALASIIIATATVHADTLRRGSSLSAAGSSGQDTFFSGYFDFGTGSTVDNAIKLENPTAIDGNICAMIYVFDTREEMGECCGCLLTPNQIRYGSIKALIGSKWIGQLPSQGVIQIVSAVPNNGASCAPTTSYLATPTLDGWITHAQTMSGISSLTEVPLTDNGNTDSAEGNNLVFLCGAIQGNGSGFGVCTCPTSDEAGIP